ncbi:major intrinsic protein [Emiliania huxleyi CCMP1516]|uniref:Aquaporin n=4 Tax=Emiliania huxleyi TaxID=2903 RepID=A0A0D3J6A5_EMIH1|nr:major intrinsic protein [Emiliania huxleyi CCMP1516]EOD19040.1 major intrinsic protein [Emiliania huxleyi CCMP1516]|eukprot:XP_005771469.1 major intrinsic protein [Emiliania huxleyi CCMP1516]
MAALAIASLAPVSVTLVARPTPHVPHTPTPTDTVSLEEDLPWSPPPVIVPEASTDNKQNMQDVSEHETEPAASFPLRRRDRRSLLLRVRADRPPACHRNRKDLRTRCLAEAVGSGILVLAASAASAAALSPTSTSLLMGGVVGSAVLSFATISGAHFNPAITCAQTVGGTLPRSDWLPYIASQIAGASAAALTIAPLLPPAGLPPPPAHFFAEVAVTALLFSACLAIGDGVEAGAVSRRGSAGLVGVLISALGLAFGSTNAALNPAMSAAPRIAAIVLSGGGTAALSGARTYALGPCVGAVLGGSCFAVATGRGGGLYGCLARLGAALSAGSSLPAASPPAEPSRRVVVPNVGCRFSSATAPVAAAEEWPRWRSESELWQWAGRGAVGAEQSVAQVERRSDASRSSGRMA